MKNRNISRLVCSVCTNYGWLPHYLHKCCIFTLQNDWNMAELKIANVQTVHHHVIGVLSDNAFIPNSGYHYKISSVTQLAPFCLSLMSKSLIKQPEVVSDIQFLSCKCVPRVIIVHLHTRARHKVNSSNYSVGSVLVLSGWFHFLALATAIKHENNDTMIASATTTQPQGVLNILQYSLSVALHRLTLLLCSSNLNL